MLRVVRERGLESRRLAPEALGVLGQGSAACRTIRAAGGADAISSLAREGTVEEWTCGAGSLVWLIRGTLECQLLPELLLSKKQRIN